MMRWTAPLAALLLFPVAALAEITGKPATIDAGTIAIAGQRIALDGVDAPGWEQTCLANGRQWRCGMEAASALAFFIAGNWVTCHVRRRDNTGLVWAVCYAGGDGGPEINAWLVAQGWALAGRTIGAPRYLAEEKAARQAHRGLWRGTFLPPSDWRKENPGAGSR